MSIFHGDTSESCPVHTSEMRSFLRVESMQLRVTTTRGPVEIKICRRVQSRNLKIEWKRYRVDLKQILFKEFAVLNLNDFCLRVKVICYLIHLSCPLLV